MAASQKQFDHESTSRTIGTKVPLNSVREQGAYVCNWDGNLVRVPETVSNVFTSPFFNVVSKDALFVTKISEDPYVSISTARRVASNLDVRVNF